MKKHSIKKAALLMCGIFLSGVTFSSQVVWCAGVFFKPTYSKDIYGTISIGTASWYSIEACKFNHEPSCPTASGASLYELEREGRNFGASWDYPLGTRVKVTNLSNGKTTIAEILDRGPNKRLSRLIDLSKKSFQEISPLSKGIIKVKVEKI